MEFDPKQIKLIIGLGNPGPEHDNTYHNSGFSFIEYLEKNPQVKSLKFKVIKSEEYMNNSGKFVAKATKKIGAKPEEILIAHDDSDLEIGKYKIDFGRGAAGHHGIESIQQHLKTNDFWRIRIGIRPATETVRQKADPPSLKLRRARAGEFVLKKISAADMATLKKVYQEVQTRLSLSE